jgi:hypothetical protein
MGNFIGKALIEAKKVGEVISKASSEIGAVVGEATKNISETAKRAAKISMLKAEIEGMYKDLGKAVFEDGLLLTNEKALELMQVMMDKYKEVMELEAEEKAENDLTETPETSDLNWDFVDDMSFGKEDETETKEEVKDDKTETKEEVKEDKKSAKKSSKKNIKIDKEDK